MPAPVALFVYNRPAHTRAALQALRANGLAAESDLIIFSDGPKRAEDELPVEEVRAIARSVRGFRRVEMVERAGNLGLACSLIRGVTETLASHGRAVFLEDDMIASPYFLAFMNQALDIYAGDENVACISSYAYPVGRPLPETYFLRGADCSGWATWSRGWACFEPDGPKLLSELLRRGLSRRFDFDGTFSFTRMLRRQIAGELDSWAIRWYASAFLAGKLTLYPGRSLTRNIGYDGTGVHCPNTDEFDVTLADTPIAIVPGPPREDEEAFQILRGHFRRTRQSPSRLLRRLIWRLRS